MQVKAAKHFRENLREALKVLDVTQDELAIKAEFSRPYINRVLAGRQDPSLPTCDSIADALGIPLAEMLAESAVFRRFLKKFKMPVAMK